MKKKKDAENRDRTSDLQIFSLTLSQLSYFGYILRLAYSTKVVESVLIYPQFAPKQPPL